MDVLSDVLDVLKLEGSLFFRSELEAPWEVKVPVEGKKAILHIIAEGSCQLHMEEGRQPLTLHRGDLILLTNAEHQQHRLFDNTDTAVEQQSIMCGVNKCAQVSGPAFLPASPDAALTQSPSSGKTVLICGYFDFDEEIVHPFFRFLPMLMHVTGQSEANLRWLDHTIHLIREEAFSQRSGADAVANRMSEILFIKALRIYIENNHEQFQGLAAMHDRYIKRALDVIHERYQEGLDLPFLARESGLSRTAFSQRFNKLVGVPAAQYLTQWRLQKAKTLLAQSNENILDVAVQIGYQSESAFNKVFKKHFGITPGAYRCKQNPRVTGWL